ACNNVAKIKDIFGRDGSAQKDRIELIAASTKGVDHVHFELNGIGADSPSCLLQCHDGLRVIRTIGGTVLRPGDPSLQSYGVLLFQREEILCVLIDIYDFVAYSADARGGESVNSVDDDLFLLVNEMTKSAVRKEGIAVDVQRLLHKE